MKAILQILIGLILIIALVWLVFFSPWWGLQEGSGLLWKSVYTVFLGGLAWIVLLIAIALIVVGFSDINSK